jgi:hypothetical protein
MAVLEQQKHLKPLMTQAIAKLVPILTKALSAFSNPDRSSFTGDSHSEERVQSAIASSEYTYATKGT